MVSGSADGPWGGLTIAGEARVWIPAAVPELTAPSAPPLGLLDLPGAQRTDPEKSVGLIFLLPVGFQKVTKFKGGHRKS